MQWIFSLAYFSIAISQMSAGMEGIHLCLGVGAFASFLLFLLSYVVPMVGSVLVAAEVHYGAHQGWDWEWWQALALVIPGIVFWLAVMTMGGLASIFGRRT